MKTDPSEVCACLHHTTVSLYVVSCETKELATARLELLDMRTGDFQSTGLELRRRIHSDLPGKRLLMRATSQLLSEAMYHPGVTPSLAQHWTHRPVDTMNVGPFDDQFDPPMPGQGSFEDLLRGQSKS